MPLVYNMLQKMPYSEKNKQVIEALQRAEKLRILSQIQDRFVEQLEALTLQQRQFVDQSREFRISKKT